MQGCRGSSGSAEGTVFLLGGSRGRKSIWGGQEPPVLTVWGGGSQNVLHRVGDKCWCGPRMLPSRGLALCLGVPGHPVAAVCRRSQSAGALVVWRQTPEELASW